MRKGVSGNGKDTESGSDGTLRSEFRIGVCLSGRFWGSGKSGLDGGF